MDGTVNTAEELDELLATAVEQSLDRAFTHLSLAALQHPLPVDARHLQGGAHLLPDPDIVVRLAGHCQGDVAGALVEAMNEGRLSWEREGVALLLGAWWDQKKGEGRARKSHAAKEGATGHYGGRAFSHLTHRQLIGWIGLWLPFVLFILAGVWYTSGLPRWQTLESRSAYYYTGATSAFIGMLFALALLRLGAVDVIDREEYAGLEVDAKVELIRFLVPLGLMHIEELLDEEVTALAGERYARKDPSVGGRRHGSNPGTVGLAGQRVPIRVPRIRHVMEREIPLRSYEARHGDRAVNDLLLRRVLYGISCRNYAAAAEAIPGAIGLSGSTVSRAFIQASATKLRALQERDLSGEDVVALVLDGKTFAEATMVVALGITMTGDKRFLGFGETDTENEKVLTPFLRSLVERGLDVSQGLLVIVDGGKGLRAGRAEGLPPPRAGATVSVAPARERGELRGQA